MTTLAEAFQAARVAAGRLQQHHFVSIVDAALRHFADAIRKDELEVVRQERFRNHPPADWTTVIETRDAQLSRLHESMAERRMIVIFLQMLSRALSVASAEAFAEELRRSGFWRGHGRAS